MSRKDYFSEYHKQAALKNGENSVKEYSVKEYSIEAYSEMLQNLDNDDIKLYSFDVFDTVLARSTASSYGIFAIMQQYLNLDHKYKDFPKEFIRNFYILRIDAEKLAREKKPKNSQEITLKEIYTFLGYDFALSNTQVEMLMKEEMSIEYNCAVGVPMLVDIIRELQARNKRIVFISDMYLDCDFIKSLLMKICPEFEDITLYVSSQYGKTKSKGSLFEVVREKENIEYKEWMHIGDNKHSDIMIPNKLGIRTKFITYLSNNAFARFIDKLLATNVNAHLYIGVSKIAALENNDFMFRVGCEFGGPLLVSYVEWILEQCIERDIKRLYFIARDGYVIKKMADLMIEKKSMAITTKYIYGSRESWRVAERDKVQILSRYLAQEIDFTDEKFAFVDLFGSGFTQDCMAKVLRKMTNYRVKCFYYKLDKYNNEISDKFGFCRNADIWNNIELFCKAPHGQCIGFKRVDGSIVPICNEEEGAAIIRFGFNNYMNGVYSFTKHYLAVSNNIIYNRSNSLEVIEWYILYVNEFPNDNLLKFLVDFPRFPKRKIKNSWVSRVYRKSEQRIKKIKYLCKVIEKNKIFNLIKR